MTSPERTPRVALVGPPLAASGGIGRVMAAALAALPADQRPVAVLDTRGHSRRPALSAGPLALACGRLAGLAWRGRVDVVHVNVSSHGSTARKALVVGICRALRLPVVLHLHASSYPEFYAALPAPARRVVRRTFRAADRTLVLSGWWRDYARDVLGVPPDRLAVLPNATEGPADHTPRRREPDEPLRLLFLGRLGERKGVPDLLAALASAEMRRRRWTAVLAGDGDVGAYTSRATALGIGDRVELPGWLAPTEVERLLAAAHVLVLPSYAEGLPMSVVEALAWGVPAVCTPVGGVPEVVTDGVQGLVVAAGDVAGLTAALGRLADDEDLRRSLAAKARATWQDRFAIGPYAARLADEWAGVARVGH